MGGSQKIAVRSPRPRAAQARSPKTPPGRSFACGTRRREAESGGWRRRQRARKGAHVRQAGVVTPQGWFVAEAGTRSQSAPCPHAMDLLHGLANVGGGHKRAFFKLRASRAGAGSSRRSARGRGSRQQEGRDLQQSRRSKRGHRSACGFRENVAGPRHAQLGADAPGKIRRPAFQAGPR